MGISIANPNNINAIMNVALAIGAFEAAGCGQDIRPPPRVCPPPEADPTGRPPWWQRTLNGIGTGIQAVGMGVISACSALGGLWVMPGQCQFGDPGA